jgi:Uma2 family endonuclease
VAPAKKPATYADIEALPEHLVGEIIDGELFVSPRPRPVHARAEGKIHADLDGAFDRLPGGPGGPPGGWWLLIEPELHLEKHVMVPDIASWRRERMPEFPREVGITLAPNWVCEVLSPSTAQLDRTKKLMKYFSLGVEWVWLVDPVLRTVEVFRWWGGQAVLGGMFAGNARVAIPPFQAIEVDMTNWWPPMPGGAAEAPVVWASSAISEP